MESQILMDEELFERVLDRLAHQLLEHHDFSRTDIVGLQPRGYDLAKLLKSKLELPSKHHKLRRSGHDLPSR